MKREKQISYNRPAPVEVLPESPELERAVLGALILESDQLSDVAEIVEISAFHTPNNGKIYGVMLSMLAWRQNRPLHPHEPPGPQRPGDAAIPHDFDQCSRFRR